MTQYNVQTTKTHSVASLSLAYLTIVYIFLGPLTIGFTDRATFYHVFGLLLVYLSLLFISQFVFLKSNGLDGG